MDVDMNISKVVCQLKASVALACKGGCGVHTRPEGIRVSSFVFRTPTDKMLGKINDITACLHIYLPIDFCGIASVA